MGFCQSSQLMLLFAVCFLCFSLGDFWCKIVLFFVFSYATIFANKFMKRRRIIMTELEIAQRAKLYIDQLAQGIDPVSGQELPEDSALNNIRLARCFFYVSGVLEQVIRNGGHVGAVQKSEFTITPEQLATVQISAYPIRITEFANALLQAVDSNSVKKLNVTKITNWLIEQGFLSKEVAPDGKKRRVPTAAGRSLGMTTQMRQSTDGEYLAIYYDANAQRFLLDHLYDILR